VELEAALCAPTAESILPVNDVSMPPRDTFGRKLVAVTDGKPVTVGCISRGGSCVILVVLDAIVWLIVGTGGDT